MNSARPLVSGQQRSATILVIDELLLFSTALAHTLKGKGFDAHSLSVTNLKAMQTAALAHKPGLVLLDLDLSSGLSSKHIDGVDLIAPLCKQGWTVLVITGTASLDRIADAITRGATNWIRKGATYAELVHAIEELMQGRGQLQPIERAALIECQPKARATPEQNDTATVCERATLTPEPLRKLGTPA